jgi:VWFA-related protein
MNASRRSCITAIAAAALDTLLPAQQPATAPDVRFSTDVKVVNIFATVRDKKGQIVKGLTQNDFVLDEDGQPQTIRYFSAESDLPLTLGLLVDTSGSTRNVLGDERSASYRFVDQVLREDKDQAFVIHFDSEVELLQDLTNSRTKLDKALDQLRAAEPQMQRRDSGGGYPGGDRNGGARRGRRGGTSLYDAVLLASDELMSKQKGRKALVLLSDGMDNGSKVSLEEATRAAQRADTLVYTILFTDTEAFGYPGGGPFGGPGRRRGGLGGGGYPPRGGANRPDGKKIMQQIAQETGARAFEASKKEQFDKVYASIQEDLRNQYNIGYTSTNSDRSGGYRRIHLTTTKKELRVQAREGYYPS